MGGQPVGDAPDADIPGDVALERRGIQTQRAQGARQAPSGMVGGQNEERGAVAAEDFDGAGLVLFEKGSFHYPARASIFQRRHSYDRTVSDMHASAFPSRSAAWLAVFLLAASACFAPAKAASMSLSSPAFADGGPLPRLFAGNGGDCGGDGVSPPLAWSNLPEAARSLAILMFDPDGAKGLGVSHWLAYNIPAGRGGLAQGEGGADGAFVTLGRAIGGTLQYRGMCPPIGDKAHHYIITAIATDLDPGALPPGLDREGLFAALKGHALAAQSIVGLYARPAD